MSDYMSPRDLIIVNNRLICKMSATNAIVGKRLFNNFDKFFNACGSNTSNER